MRPAEVLKQALTALGGADAVTPATTAEVDALSRRLGRAIPDELRELVSVASGLTIDSDALGAFGIELDFLGQVAGQEWPNAFHSSFHFGHDGCGNSWLIELPPKSTGEDVRQTADALGPVLFSSHDPPFIAIQAADLTSFLLEVIRPDSEAEAESEERPLGTSMSLEDVSVELTADGTISNVELANLVKGLPAGTRVADLRALRVGTGFSCDISDPERQLRRLGPELVWAITPRKRRFFGLR